MPGVDDPSGVGPTGSRRACRLPSASAADRTLGPQALATVRPLRTHRPFQVLRSFRVIPPFGALDAVDPPCPLDAEPARSLDLLPMWWLALAEPRLEGTIAAGVRCAVRCRPEARAPDLFGGGRRCGPPGAASASRLWCGLLVRRHPRPAPVLPPRGQAARIPAVRLGSRRRGPRRRGDAGTRRRDRAQGAARLLAVRGPRRRGDGHDRTGRPCPAPVVGQAERGPGHRHHAGRSARPWRPAHEFPDSGQRRRAGRQSQQGEEGAGPEGEPSGEDPVARAVQRVDEQAERDRGAEQGHDHRGRHDSEEDAIRVPATRGQLAAPRLLRQAGQPDQSGGPGR